MSLPVLSVLSIPKQVRTRDDLLLAFNSQAFVIVNDVPRTRWSWDRPLLNWNSAGSSKSTLISMRFFFLAFGRAWKSRARSS